MKKLNHRFLNHKFKVIGLLLVMATCLGSEDFLIEIDVCSVALGVTCSEFEQAYIKASNTESYDHFGYSIALSSDGNTLAVGALVEDSNATGVNGDQTNNSATNSGAVYIRRIAP